MKMKRLTLILAAATALLAQPDVQLQRAMRLETLDGNLKGAIAQYEVLARSSDRTVAAKALVRMGLCYEKLGSTEARKAYERALREFPGETESAATARARLAQLAGAAIESGALSSRLLFSQPGVRGPLGRVSEDGRTFPYLSAEGNVVVRDLHAGVSHEIRNRSGKFDPSGMWWAPVPSPDGGRVAFASSTTGSGYQLHIVPAAGGESRAVPLEAGPDGWFSPWDWSRDGKSLAGWANIASRKIWNLAIVDIQTGEMKVPFARRSQRCEKGVISPDSKQIAAACYVNENVNMPPNRDIVVFDIVTGKEVTILGGPYDDRSPVWAPADGRILFVSNRQGKDGLWMVEPKPDGSAAPVLLQGDLGVTELLGLSKDGTLHYGRRTQSRDVYLATLDPSSLGVQGQPTRFLDTYLGHNSAPAWSPSGDAFAYVSFRDISGKSRFVVRGNDGSEVVSTESNMWDDQTPTWCSDSRLLSWGTPHPATRHLYDAATGAVAGPDTKITGLRAAYQLGYAPDCRSVYVSARPHGSERREIFRVDVETQQRTDLYSDDAEWSLAPTVSPDGKWLAMIGRTVRGGPVGVILMSTSGGAPRMLATGAGDNVLRWTPDSKHLFFVKLEAGQEEFFAVSIEGGSPVATGIRGRGLIGLSLHPDGKRALFSSRESSAEVWSLRNFLPK